MYAFSRFWPKKRKKVYFFLVYDLDCLFFPIYGRMKLELWRPLKWYIYQRDKEKCKQCKKKVEYENSHCHHVQSIGKGGSNIPKNLETVCIECHYKIHPFMRNAREKTKMKTKQVKKGLYKYKLPDWENTILVVVEEIDKELFVRFEAGRYPSRLQDIPANAIFEHTRE